MSLNKAFQTQMKKTVANLVDNADVIKETNTVVFDASKIELPENVTQDSIQTHVDFFNDVSAAQEAATADIANSLFANNDKLTTVDSTLILGEGLTIQSQHHLKQKVGDDYIYGESTTMLNFLGNEDQAKWLDDIRETNKLTATALFNK